MCHVIAQDVDERMINVHYYYYYYYWKKLLGDLIQVVFHRALASSSRAVTLVNPERFLGNNF